MKTRAKTLILTTVLSAAALAAPAPDFRSVGGLALWRHAAALAEPAGGAPEKEAFDDAKELGTAEAWEAFLTAYPSGFRADLARAYVKKLAQPGTASQPAKSVETANELPCSDAAKLKAYQSTDAAKIRFINESGAVRVIQWIDFNGAIKEYFELKPGEEKVQDTFLTHPWIAAFQEGSCSQLFMPGNGETVARLVSKDAPQPKASKQDDGPGDHGPTPYQSCRNVGKVYYNGVCVSPKKKKTPAQSARASCLELGMGYVNGKCVAKSKKDVQRFKNFKNVACPKGLYRNPLGKCQPNETGG